MGKEMVGYLWRDAVCVINLKHERKGKRMKQETHNPLELFLRRLVIAPKGKQTQAIESALALLDGSPPPDQLLYSGAQACRMLAISQPTLYRMKKAGTIKPVFLRSRPRYRAADLKKLAEGGR